MIKEVRGRGLMIGIELRAPRSRVARLNWRLIHLASEGLFPQLIVIPLHRDHGVITMAAGQERRDQAAAAADAVRDAEADSFLDGARRRARRLPRRRRARTGASCATSPRRRCAASSARRRRAATGDAVPRQAGRPGARGRLPGHRRDRVHRRAPGRSAWSARATRCAASCVRAATRSRLDGLDVEIAVGDLTSREFAAPRRRGLPLRVPLRRARVRLGAPSQEIEARPTSRGPGTCSRPASARRCGAWSTSARPTSTGIRAAGDRRDLHGRRGFANWYAQTKLAAEAEVRRAQRDARASTP